MVMRELTALREELTEFKKLVSAHVDGIESIDVMGPNNDTLQIGI